MKKAIIMLVFVIIFLNALKAEIIFTQQPEDVYNLGDQIHLNLVIKSSADTSGTLYMNLICENQETNFYKSGIVLVSNQEKEIASDLILIKEIINNSLGKCKIEALLKNDRSLSKEFKISNNINVSFDLEKTNFDPEEIIKIEGAAIKENNKEADGFVEAEIKSSNKSIAKKLATLNKGKISIEIKIPEKLESKKYDLILTAYEKDSENRITNIGSSQLKIFINQVPTNLEIIFENNQKEVLPGESLFIKTILHDQTGKPIKAKSKIKIKNNDSKIIEQKEIDCGVFNEIKINNNEPPKTWTIAAESNSIFSLSTFKILEKKEISISLKGSILEITNTGNVPYQNNLTIKINNTEFNFFVNLKIGETKEYRLKAPEGNYSIEVLSNPESSEFSSQTFLTGNTISIKERKSNPWFIIIWIFILTILGLTAYILFKKNRRKPFSKKLVGLGILSKKKSTQKHVKDIKDSLLKTKNKAVISLSMSGDKQKSTIVCLDIKNLKELDFKKQDIKDSLQKIVDLAENNKALIYESDKNIFIMLAPSQTKTFKNEPVALEIAKGIKKILKYHNKLFKQKIDFGIFISNSIIILNKEEDIFKFTSIGTGMQESKKRAVLSNEQILLSKEVADALKTRIKAERFHEQEDVYYIKEFKKYDDRINKKFVENFLKKLEKESSKNL